MTERPFPCTSEEVRAIRSNLKTQSRSLRGLQRINEDPGHWSYGGTIDDERDPNKTWHRFYGIGGGGIALLCPWGAAGDRLWVQETWAPFEYSYEDTVPSDLPSYCQIVYRVDCKPTDDTWRSSTQMPRWASRDTLENVSVRPERLQSITEADAIAEGAQGPGFPADLTNRGAFAKHWNLRHGKTAPWAQNKWVWRIEHRRVNER